MRQQLQQLQDVFLRSAFVVPDYQRGYAWTDEHRTDLLNDLSDLDVLAPERMHYTGTLVLHQGQHAPKQVMGKTIDVRNVVDGQQRLTSLVILLSVIARRLHSFATDDARERARNIRETYIAYRDVQKLTPNGGAAPFFRDHVIGDSLNAMPASPPERALLAARAQFDAFVNEHLEALPDETAQLGWLDRWSMLVTTRLGFVIFDVQDEADVGVMFEVMNARGKALTQFELVKNYLLFVAAKIATGDTLHVLTDDVNHTWSKAVGILDAAELSDSDDTLLRYHWWIWPYATGLDGESLAKTHNIHGAIKETIRVAGEPEVTVELIRRYLSDFRLAAQAFADLSAPQSSKAFAFAGQLAATLSDRATSLARIGRSAVVLPLLMAVTLQAGNDHAGLDEVIRLAEAFSFRLALVGSRSNAGEPQMMRLAHDTRRHALTTATVQQRLREIVNYYAPDSAVTRTLLEPDSSTKDGNFYSWQQLPHLLFEYERALVLASKQKFVHDWDAFYKRWKESIEHILPQGDNTLNNAYWAERFTDEQWRRNRHRLGNLTLTEWNSSYGNRGFDQKCGTPAAAHDAKVYRNSRFYCERELVQEPEWNEAAIDTRQERIAKFALKRWAV